MKTIVIYHRADFDGIFCREIARKFLPEAELIGWDYGDPEPVVEQEAQLYILDLSVPGLMRHPRLTWIDHHKSAIEEYSSLFKINLPFRVMYCIDGVAACRLAWQFFTGFPATGFVSSLPTHAAYFTRIVNEPLAVRLAGEYDIWDKRDPDAELFQHGLRSRELTADIWEMLLKDDGQPGGGIVNGLLIDGRIVQYAQTRQNESVIKEIGFTFEWEGLTFLGCNASRYNSHLFTAGLKPEHDGCFGFKWTGTQWTVSLYGVPGKPDVDLSKIAVKYGGGGHKQACGFRTKTLPFLQTV